MDHNHARSFAALTTASLLGLAGGAHGASDSTPPPAPPGIMINEVVFDPAGVDGSSIGGEWIELYMPSATSLSGYTLRTNQGTVIATLPAVTAPAHSVLVVFLRATLPFGYDTSFADRSAAFASGAALGDHLGNDQGGVRLVDSGGAIVDSVYWGTGAAPTGASGGTWPTGTYFDLSMSGKPMFEGDSIGRPAAPLTSYTGTVADWERFGGRNACSATPGVRNGVYPADVTGLITFTQTGVNQVLANLSNTEQPGWIHIDNADVAGVSGAYTSTGCTVTATHVFELTLRGELVTLSGSMTSEMIRSETAGNVWYTLTTNGALEGTSEEGGNSYELLVEHVETFTGFHTNTQQCVASTDVTYIENGTAYSVSVSGTNAITRNGATSWIHADVRQAVDYGGAGTKNSTAVTFASKVADGIYATNFGLDRSNPISPPRISQAGTQVLSGTEQMLIDAATVSNDEGEITLGLVMRLDRFSNTTSQTAQLQSGQWGTFGFSQTLGTPGTLPQSQRYEMELPMQLFGSPTQVSVEVVGSTYVVNGKLLSEAYSNVYFGSAHVMHGNFFVDPPAAQGGGGTPPQPQPANQPPPPTAPVTPGGFMEAAGDCATAGAGLGAATGGTIGGVSGGLAGSAAGGVGAVPGAIAGAKTGGLVGAGVGAALGSVVCGFLYLFGWW